MARTMKKEWSKSVALSHAMLKQIPKLSCTTIYTDTYCHGYNHPMRPRQ